MTINRAFFFDHCRTTLFDGKTSPSQVSGLTKILDRWDTEMAAQDDRWLAYMLGTAHHETGRTFQPVRETFASTDDRAIAILERSWKAGHMPWVTSPYWRRGENGQSYLGRGLVQLTHLSNYQKLSKMTGLDLIGHPDTAMNIDTALTIMFVGMTRGSFTGKALSNFFSPTKQDWRNARRIINGIERADLVASYATAYYACLSHTV